MCSAEKKIKSKKNGYIRGVNVLKKKRWEGFAENGFKPGKKE